MVNDDVSELCRDLIERILVPLPSSKERKEEEGEESPEKNMEKSRLKLGEILSHPWFKESEDPVIFNEEEVQKIREGFVYVDSTTPIDKSIEEALDDEVLDEHDFKMITITSTQDPMQRNMSSKSDILDPFNTTRSGNDVEITETYLLDNGFEFFTNKELGKPGSIIKFNLKTREVNKLYQALNNGDNDNGVENRPELDDN